jgi:hypothetical protein
MIGLQGERPANQADIDRHGIRQGELFNAPLVIAWLSRSHSSDASRAPQPYANTYPQALDVAESSIVSGQDLNQSETAS